MANRELFFNRFKKMRRFYNLSMKREDLAHRVLLDVCYGAVGLLSSHYTLISRITRSLIAGFSEASDMTRRLYMVL